jgi:peptidyl-prolyl cis-trans isomerase B (cyclophilin B)
LNRSAFFRQYSEEFVMDDNPLRSKYLSRLVLLAVLLSWTCGCSRKKDPEGKDAAKVTDPANPVTNASFKPIETSPLFAALHQSFKDATTADPPAEAKRPPDTLATGKSVGHMYEQIVGANGQDGLWDKIRFLAPDGKPIRYRAVIKTDLGDIRIDLLSEVAPNHVRNYIALAKVGYYDGLAFDLIGNQKIGDDPWIYLDAGCPLRTGEGGYGSIGYWLLPEISEKLVHEEGTVGAWHGEALDSAACKFYITLTKAPYMDGEFTIFGKIIQGLDIANKISQVPQDKETGRPRDPVIMRSVTIETR